MKDIRKSILSSNYGGPRGRKVDTIVFHHIVGDAPAAISRFKTAGEQVSSTYIIGSDGTVYYTVDEKNTPYTNGDSDWNRRSITIEHAGPPYSEKMYKASIALCQSIRKRHNIKYFKRHRDLYPTECPGKLNVERIVKASKGEDMYKGKSAKYWYLRLVKQRRYTTKVLGWLATWRDRFKKLKGKV